MASSASAVLFFGRLVVTALPSQRARPIQPSKLRVPIARCSVENRQVGKVGFSSMQGALALMPMPGRVGYGRGAHVVSATAGDEGDGDELEVDIKVTGMVCGGCSGRVEEALKKQAGVATVHVDLEKGLATVKLGAKTMAEAMDTLPKLLTVVEDLGFQAEPLI